MNDLQDKRRAMAHEWAIYAKSKEGPSSSIVAPFASYDAALAWAKANWSQHIEWSVATLYRPEDYR